MFLGAGFLVPATASLHELIFSMDGFGTPGSPADE